MSNVTRFANNFAQSDFQNAMSALNLLTQVLDDSKGLSPRDKSRMVRMGKANLRFVESAHRVVEALPDLRPAFLDPVEFERDLLLIKSSKSLMLKLLEVYSMVEDTELLMGNHAFRSALAIYRVVQAAYRMGYPGVKPYYEEMIERWDYAFANSSDGEGQGEPLEDDPMIDPPAAQGSEPESEGGAGSTGNQ